MKIVIKLIALTVVLTVFAGILLNFVISQRETLVDYQIFGGVVAIVIMGASGGVSGYFAVWAIRNPALAAEAVKK